MKIKCEICGAERSMLTSHIRTSHNLTKEEYLKLYPESKLISDERRETMKKAAKECWTDDLKERRSVLSKKMWDNEEYRNNMSKKKSEYMKEKWKNEEYRNYISKCSKNFMTKEWESKTEEYKNKFGEMSSERLKKMWKDEKYVEHIRMKRRETWSNEEYRNKFSKRLSDRWKSKEYRDYMKEHISAAQIENWKKEEYIEKLFCSKINTGLWNKESVISTQNRLFSKFLEDNNIDTEFEFRISKKFYDIHLLNSNYLIEIDPTYTHNSTNCNIYSSIPCDKNYHINKTNIACKNGYKCIHVFDWDNWNAILEIINPYKRKIYARKCSLEELDICLYKEFLKTNNVDDNIEYNDNYVIIGLKYNEEIVIAAYFEKYEDKYIINNITSSENTIIVGGVSRIFKNFIKFYNPVHITSYCDLSKFTGYVYSIIGMKLTGISDPICHWVYKGNHIVDNAEIDRESMIQNGYVEVYDCGYGIYEWDRDGFKQ